jgi:hypothetical protein
MKLQVVTYQRGDKWFVMGLEHCIFAKATTLPEAISLFLKELALQSILDRGEGYEPLSETPPAPEEFWEKYRNSQFHLVIDFPLPEEARTIEPEIRVAA